MKCFVLVLLASVCLSCADESDAKEAVQILGWSNIVVDDRNDFIHFGCAEHDQTQFHVHGLDAAGRHAHAIVCCGAGPFGKGCTPRVER